MIQIRNLGKSYPDGEIKLCVLDNINMEIEQGSISAIMGRSGCGKSTLLHILGGIVTPDYGDIKIQDIHVDYHNKKQLYHLRRNYFGFVVQNFALIQNKTAWENVILPIENKNKSKHWKEDISSLMDEVGMLEKRNKYPYQLSHGERQRLAIARALVNDKKIILADEPTGSLDLENACVVMSLFEKLAKSKNITILIATHDNMIANKCDNIFYLHQGNIEIKK